ncbi:MAG: helix-turn-helix domain-containing protein [Lentisphaerae bacterium]|nr:helix-turn-helix domain-containing protein [Lentisphaerota bacterium]
MSYTRVTNEERRLICDWLQDGKCSREIARLLKSAASAVMREVVRNTGGLIRRLYPKNESFAAIGEADLRRIDMFLNDRPLKCLGWKTPREVMDAFLAAAA